jgi:predicted GNAT family acetyltransferase
MYLCKRNAVVAQLVEHNLAKVRVAGSSPVYCSRWALVVEVVDTQDLKSCGQLNGRAGSSPAQGTGRLAQLVQSTCLTSRGSMVRVH